MTLYELPMEYQELLDALEDEEMDEEMLQAACLNLQKALDQKAEGYVKVLKELEAEQLKFDTEIKRLQKRKKTFEKNIENIKKSLLVAMTAMERKTIQTEMFKLTVKNTAASVVIDVEEDVPKEYRIPQPDKIDKKLLKEFLQKPENEECPFAHLEKGSTLLIS